MKALAKLRSRSCIIDGEAVACGDDGIASFERMRKHLDEQDGPLVFRHACKLGLEGIVSKRRDSFYSSGRSPHWIKSKNPNAPAVNREAEEDWGARSTKPRRSRREP